MSLPGSHEHGFDERGSDEHGSDEHSPDDESAGDGVDEPSEAADTVATYPVENVLSGFEAVEIDTTRPNPARMYDYLLGGYDNYEADRIAAEQVIAAMPETRRAARELRTFMHRVVRFMADEGIRQFLDIGSGLPTTPNVHEIAGAIAPGVRVAYIDNDPIVRVHAQSRLANTGDNIFVLADLREPQTIMEDAALRDLFDLDQPIGLLLGAVLYYLSDEDEPGRIIATLRDMLPAGSYIAASHVTNDLAPPEELAELAAIGPVMDRSTAPMTVRTEPEFRAFFDGFELVEPGLVQISRWRPELATEADGAPQGKGVYAFGAVGRKN
jgi:hypothetical protein